MSNSKRTKAKFIDDVQVTNDCLTSRAGLNLFARYIRGIGLFPHINRLFGSMRKNPKGTPIDELFKQVLCFLFDGTSRHLAHFDVLTKDPGYAAAIETDIKSMAYTPFNLPDKKLLTDTFQDLVTTLKPSTDHYYRTQCECGEILPLDSLFYDRVPLRHTGISLHERLGKTGENITFRRQFKCPKCGATEKFFDEYDQGVLDEIEKLPDHKIFDFKLIENSRINLNLNRAEGSH